MAAGNCTLEASPLHQIHDSTNSTVHKIFIRKPTLFEGVI
jgi:hypothetical protein